MSEPGRRPAATSDAWSASGRPRVLVLQKLLPHYRVRLFQELGRSQKFDFTLAYDPNFTQASLRSVPDPPGVTVAPVHNWRLGRARESDALVYQQGAVPLVKSGQFDAVIAPLTPRIVSNLTVLRAARRRRMAFLWWGHGIGPRTRGRSLKIMLWLARQADAVIFYDQERATRMVEAGLAKQRAFVAPNSIDVEVIASLRQDTPLAARHRIVYVGRLTERKKVELLLKAFARARPRLPSETILTIIGDGPQRASLTALASQLQLGAAVQLTGPLYDQSQLAPYFNQAWVSVSPGPVGLAAVHSFAFGLPMIVARHEGHGPEISLLRGDVNGLFVPSDDEAALAEALVAVRSDAGRWASLAAAALATIDPSYGLAQMVARFEDALGFALENKSGGRS